MFKRSALTAQEQQLPSLIPPTEHDDDTSGHLHRLIIGLLGASLPLVVWGLSALRPMEGLHRFNLLDSISAYYYSGAGPAFVGILACIGICFYSYTGYRNQFALWERLLAIAAGTAAIFVAVFPTTPPEPLPPSEVELGLGWWTSPMQTVHIGSAIFLFVAFAVFSLFLFTRGKRPYDTDKKVRNGIYTGCGIGILVGLGWALVAFIMDWSIYWPETLMIACFAFSWLVKGRIDVSVKNAWANRYYVFRPIRLANRILHVIGAP